MKTTLKYLETFAEPEIPRGLYRNIFFPKPENRYNHCAVIPLYGEPDWHTAGLESLLQAAKTVSGKTLLIVVINRHELSSSSIELTNQKVLDFFGTLQPIAFTDFPLMTLIEYDSCLDIIVLNHNHEPHLFSSKEGVGKARKLGCDLAVALATTPILQCKFIHTTDGDALVESDYFSMEFESSADVLLHPYTHTGNYEQMQALHIYENSLRYYVAGLKYANSPYAHESLGSTIAITPDCYAAVRGFPKRNAAEDFYLLNKAVKVGRLEQSHKGLVKLIGRKSNRVPFGTGVGTEKINDKLEQNVPVSFYHPDSFQILKNIISVISDWSESEEQIPNPETMAARAIDSTAVSNALPLQSLLEALGFFKILETAKQQRTTPKSIFKHCHESWDGFKTLKLIHGLRDGQYGFNFERSNPLECITSSNNSASLWDALFNR